MKRGEVWWADLPDPLGSGPGFRRPVVVVQANPFNVSAIQTVIVAIVTSNETLALAPGNLILERGDSGLPRRSVLNVSQIMTLDRDLLTDRVRMLASPLLEELDAGLRLALGL